MAETENHEELLQYLGEVANGVHTPDDLNKAGEQTRQNLGWTPQQYFDAVSRLVEEEAVKAEVITDDQGSTSEVMVTRVTGSGLHRYKQLKEE